MACGRAIMKSQGVRCFGCVFVCSGKGRSPALASLKEIGLEKAVDGCGFERFDDIIEFADVLKLTINGSIADKGNGVDFLEPGHHLRTDHAARKLLEPFGGQFIDDLLDRSFENLERDGAFFAGLNESGKNLLPFERLTCAISLDDEHVAALNLFVGRKTVPAIQAFATSTNRKTILGQSRIDHFII